MSEADEAQWREANRDEMPSSRVITEGPGLHYGNQPHGSIGIRLSDETREEIQGLRKHYVEAERSYALQAWCASHRGAELDSSVYYGWRSEAEVRWAAKFPHLASLLQLDPMHTASPPLP